MKRAATSITRLPTGTLLLLSLVLLLLYPLLACAPERAPRRPAVDAGQLDAPRDETFATSGTIYARHYSLTTQLAVPGAAAFAELAAPTRRRLDRLRRVSRQVTEVYALADRVLVVLPEHHPSGPLELLLCDDLDRLLVFDMPRKIMLSLPRERFPDLLDMVEGSERDLIEANLTAIEDARSVGLRRAQSHHAEILLKYRPPRHRATRWSVRMTYETTERVQTRLFPYQQPLPHLALPLLQDYRGLLLLETLAQRTAIPSRWVVSLTNETHGTLAVTRRTEVIDRGRERLPLRRFAAARDGFTVVPRLRWVASPRPLIAPRDLVGLRPADAAGPLHLTNNSAFAVQVYLDGVMIAWLAPQRELAIDGLSAGFYRLFAASSTGVRSWGPDEIYVPGPWTLD